MSGGDRQALIQWREALLWVAKAQADIAGARTLLSSDQIDLAAFLVQQGLEKALKALLVAAAQDARRTHDIDALATVGADALAAAPGLAFFAGDGQPVVGHHALSRSRRVAADSGRGCPSTGGGCRLRLRRSAAFPARSCGQRREGGGAEAMSKARQALLDEKGRIRKQSADRTRVPAAPSSTEG
jgi:hypothetical protein